MAHNLHHTQRTGFRNWCWFTRLRLLTVVVCLGQLPCTAGGLFDRLIQRLPDVGGRFHILSCKKERRGGVLVRDRFVEVEVVVHLVLRPVNLALARESGVDKAPFDLTRRVSVPLVRLQEAEPIGKGEAHGGQSSSRGQREEGDIVQATCEDRRQRGNGGGKNNYATSGRVSVSQGHDRP